MLKPGARRAFYAAQVLAENREPRSERLPTGRMEPVLGPRCIQPFLFGPPLAAERADVAGLGELRFFRRHGETSNFSFAL